MAWLTCQLVSPARQVRAAVRGYWLTPDLAGFISPSKLETPRLNPKRE